MAGFVDELAARWSVLAAHSPHGADRSTPWFYEETSGTVFVVADDPQTAAYLNDSQFAQYLNEVYGAQAPGRLRVLASVATEVEWQLAVALRLVNGRLSELEAD